MSIENDHEITEAEAHKPRSWNFLMVIVLTTIVGFAAIIILSGNNNPNSPNNQILTPQQDGDELVISVASLTTKARFYVYSTGGMSYDFFGVIGPDNHVHFAFDACDSCFAAKLGYRQNDILMICNNCGNQFLINGIGTENLLGGCWPSYLPITVANGEITIKISDVVSKKYLFE